jgi:hypothetical protein
MTFEIKGARYHLKPSYSGNKVTWHTIEKMKTHAVKGYLSITESVASLCHTQNELIEKFSAYLEKKVDGVSQIYGTHNDFRFIISNESGAFQFRTTKYGKSGIDYKFSHEEKKDILTEVSKKYNLNMDDGKTFYYTTEIYERKNDRRSSSFCCDAIIIDADIVECFRVEHGKLDSIAIYNPMNSYHKLIAN